MGTLGTIISPPSGLQRMKVLPGVRERLRVQLRATALGSRGSKVGAERPGMGVFTRRAGLRKLNWELWLPLGSPCPVKVFSIETDETIE